jgi:hypothetical protein
MLSTCLVACGRVRESSRASDTRSTALSTRFARTIRSVELVPSPFVPDVGVETRARHVGLAPPSFALRFASGDQGQPKVTYRHTGAFASRCPSEGLALTTHAGFAVPAAADPSRDAQAFGVNTPQFLHLSIAKRRPSAKERA